MKKFIEQIKTTKCFTGKNGQFTTHHSRLTKKLSALVPQCLRAFTLAETLIVIGIIGVVAALTLPNLNHATGDKEKVTKVKKIYSSLTDAFDRAQVVYGNADTWFKDLTTHAEKNERFAKRIIEFMKVSKDCGSNEGCFSSAPLLNFDGEVWFENYLEALQFEDDYMVMLADGVSISFHAAPNTLLSIKADIDGPNKGKNQEGNDIFHFTIGLNENSLVYSYLQLIPDNLMGGYGDWDNQKGGYDLAKWVIENGNLDYLKCPDDLNWETQTSCK